MVSRLPHAEARGVLPDLPDSTAGLLSQFMIICPRCHRPSAVHIEEAGSDGPSIVRVVCPDLCAPDLGIVFDLVVRCHGPWATPLPAVA